MNTLGDALEGIVNQLSTSIEGVNDLPIADFAEHIVFNKKIKIFPQQKALLRAYYNEPLDQQDIDILSYWKELGRTSWVEGREYTSLVLEAGRRSSKSSLVSIIILKELYDLLSLPNPGMYYGLLPSDPIAIFVFSQTLDQVTETLFGKLRGWALFSNYFRNLQDLGIIEILRQEIRSDEKNIGVYAKHTNTAALVGYAIKLLVLDEVARFSTNDKGENTGDLIWDNIGAGVATFKGTGKDSGKKIAISSAWHDQDNIERLRDLAEKDPNILAFNFRTWDLNPNMSRMDPIVVSAYAKDPVQAQLEWEGIRSKGKGNYLSEQIIKPLELGASAIDAREEDQEVTSQGVSRYYVSLKITRIEPLYEPSFGHVDLGLRKDAAAFAMSHPVCIGDGLWGVQVDAYLRWAPKMDKHIGGLRSVSFMNVEESLLYIHQYRPFQIITFDQYNSAGSIQRLHAQGVLTDEVGVSNSYQFLCYDTTKDLASNGLLILPRDSIWTPDARNELTNIEIKESGEKRKVTHGVAGKDLADAIANSVYQCYQYLVNSGKMNNLKPSITTVSASMSSKRSSLLGNRKILTPKDLGITKRLRQSKQRLWGVN
jgi:hypothetical protein